MHSRHTLPRSLGARRTVGDIGEPDPVWRFDGEVAFDPVRRDRQTVAAVGSANPMRRRHDGPDAMPLHQPFDPAAAGASSLRPQRGVNRWAAVALIAVPMDLADIC